MAEPEDYFQELLRLVLGQDRCEFGIVILGTGGKDGTVVRVQYVVRYGSTNEP